jgi:hypothetical protein
MPVSPAPQRSDQWGNSDAELETKGRLVNKAGGVQARSSSPNARGT